MRRIRVLQSSCTHTWISYKLWDTCSPLVLNSLFLFYHHHLMKNSFNEHFSVCNEWIIRSKFPHCKWSLHGLTSKHYREYSCHLTVVCIFSIMTRQKMKLLRTRKLKQLKDLTIEDEKYYLSCMIFKFDDLKSLEWIHFQDRNSSKGKNLSQ